MSRRSRLSGRQPTIVVREEVIYEEVLNPSPPDSLAVPRGIASTPTSSRVSSQGRRSSGRTRQDVSAAAGLPFVLQDYGRSTYHKVATSHFDEEDEASKYMQSPAGRELAAQNTHYTRTTHRVVSNVAAIRDRHICFLGSGASAHNLHYFRFGPASVTFVDINERAHRRMADLVESNNYHITSEVDYVCQDAKDFLVTRGRKFDVIIATKSLGGILRGVEVEDFMNIVGFALNYDGIFVADEHLRFRDSRCPTIGNTVGLTKEEWDRATVCGRYADDVCYTLDKRFDDFTRVMTWCNSINPIQGWRQFVFRTTRGDRPDVTPTLPGKVPRPVPFICEESEPLEELKDIVPPSVRGTKRIINHTDRGKYDLHHGVMPKFDGESVVVCIEGDEISITSERYRHVIEIDRFFNVPIIASGELVTTSGDLQEEASRPKVLVLTGLIGVGEKQFDPQSAAGLNSLRHACGGFEDFGVIVNGPVMTPLIRMRRVVFQTDHGSVELPIDGLNCAIGDRFGNFFKLPDEVSVDVASGFQGEETLLGAYDLLRNAFTNVVLEPTPNNQMVTMQLGTNWEGGAEGEVVEYCSADGTGLVWKFKKFRRDKNRGADQGRLMVDIAGAMSSWEASPRDYRDLTIFLTGSSQR